MHVFACLCMFECLCVSVCLYLPKYASLCVCVCVCACVFVCETPSQAAAGTLDGIIDTVSAPHPLEPLMGLIKYKGKLVMLGLPAPPPTVPAAGIIFRESGHTHTHTHRRHHLP